MKDWPNKQSRFDIPEANSPHILAVFRDERLVELGGTCWSVDGHEHRSHARNTSSTACTSAFESAFDTTWVIPAASTSMSGFELLSVVRRRFRHLPVIALSGRYNGGVPAGLIADASFSKGEYSHENLFTKIIELLEQAPIRPNISKPDKAPVWISKSDTGYFVVTCTECLRSFSIADEHSAAEYRETQCVYCGSTVSYLADLSTARMKS